MPEPCYTITASELISFNSVFYRSPITWPWQYHVLSALVCCVVLGLLAGAVLQDQQGMVSRANFELVQLKQADESGVSERRNAAPQLQPEFIATQWPHRAEVDEVVQNASLAAVKHGLTIRSLSVSHQAATPAAWGRVTLDIATNGSYAASKAWQAALQQRHPALAVQKLQLKTGVIALPASIDGQWTWVLHVRD